MILALGVNIVSAQALYELRFGHVLNESHPYQEGFEKWAERVEERTDGEFKVEVYPSSQLGVEEDVLEQIRSNVPIGWNTDSARLGDYVKDISVVNAPYFVESIEDVRKLKETPTMQKLEEELEEEYGLKVLSFQWVQGLRHFMTNEPVEKPEDLDGLRVRTPPAEVWQESVKALGATPTAMDFGDIYSGIQQGSVDGAELVYDNVTAGNLYEVLDYTSETGHILLVNFQVVSSEWFNNLPEEYQEILEEECDRAGLETSKKIMEESEEEAKEKSREEGMEIIEVDMDAFREAGMDAYEELDLLEVREQIYEEMEEVELE
ncbi:MAG: C4-dicarboxylate TRAP transporter substrate-binding protein [Halanaerobiaceae bacterium]